MTVLYARASQWHARVWACREINELDESQKALVLDSIICFVDGQEAGRILTKRPRGWAKTARLIAPAEPAADAQTLAPRRQHFVHAPRRQKTNQPAAERLDVEGSIIRLVQA